MLPREAPLAPWSELMVDLIGPWKMKVQDQDVYFDAITCIDPVTNLTELIRIKSTIPKSVLWLSI